MSRNIYRGRNHQNLDSSLFLSLPGSPPSTLPFYATNGETLREHFSQAERLLRKRPGTTLHVRNSEKLPRPCPISCAPSWARDVDGLPVTARGELASAVGIRKAGRWLSSCTTRKGEDGAPVQRSSGSVTAGIACDSKLKCDGWRVVSFPRGRGLIIQFRSLFGRWASLFFPQVSCTQQVHSEKGYC